MVEPTFLDEIMNRRPIHVAIKERADNPAVQDVFERLVMLFGRPIADDNRVCVIALRKASDAKALFIRGTAAKTPTLRRVHFLE
jgi:hypothetical protein